MSVQMPWYCAEEFRTVEDVKHFTDRYVPLAADVIAAYEKHGWSLFEAHWEEKDNEGAAWCTVERLVMQFRMSKPGPGWQLGEAWDKASRVVREELVKRIQEAVEQARIRPTLSLT